MAEASTVGPNLDFSDKTRLAACLVQHVWLPVEQVVKVATQFYEVKEIVPRCWVEFTPHHKGKGKWFTNDRDGVKFTFRLEGITPDSRSAQLTVQPNWKRVHAGDQGDLLLTELFGSLSFEVTLPDVVVYAPHVPDGWYDTVAWFYDGGYYSYQEEVPVKPCFVFRSEVANFARLLLESYGEI